MIWKTLSKILSAFPQQSIDIDIFSVILPVLKKLNTFCQDSSPQFEMLQFLVIVLKDLALKHKPPKDFVLFMDQFLLTIARCIPHNLYEEIFTVCDLAIHIMEDKLKKQHIQALIDALLDKYTMKSKAHKNLTQVFIQLVLSKSLVQSIQESEQLRLRDNLLNESQLIRLNNTTAVGPQPHFQQNQPQMSANHNFYSQQLGASIPAFQQQQINHEQIDDYDYERDSNQYTEEDDAQSEDQQMMQDFQNQQINQQLLQIAHQTNQEYHESPISQRLFHELQTNALPDFTIAQRIIQVRPSTNMLINHSIETYLDFFVESTVQNNIFPAVSTDKYQDLVKIELYFEKIALFQQILKELDSNHINMFAKVINKQSFKESLVRMLQCERSTLISIDILDKLTTFYMSNCAPKNIYEHPASIISTQQDNGIRRPNNNNNQSSQNSGYQQQNVMNTQTSNRRESSRNSFISNTQHNNNNNNALGFQLRGGIQNNSERQHIINPISQNIGQQHHSIISDELDIINRERLVLINIHAIFIRYTIEAFEKSQDQNLQFQALNMIDNLYSNLMPTPTFQNSLIKQNIRRQRGLFEEEKIHHNEIPDLEKLIILDQGQIQQHLQHNQNFNGQLSFITCEFESIDGKYLHSRLQFALRIWNFIERSLTESHWSNIKSVCYGIICQAFNIDIQDYKLSLQNKTKQALFPLLNNLLFSKESESKAGGLNIIGSLCGLGHDFSNIQSLSLNQNLHQFRKNSSFISLALWQQVYDLQEDWDSTIREASSVLIQICGPRESIKHFRSIQNERFQLKLQQMIKTYSVTTNQAFRVKQYQGETSQAQSVMIHNNESVEEYKIGKDQMNHAQEKMSYQEERKSMIKNYLQSSQSFRPSSSFAANTERIMDDVNSNSSSSENDNRRVPWQGTINGQQADDYFYVDKLSEHQIKDLLSIFKNEYKPHKTLSVEKNIANFNQTTDEVGHDANKDFFRDETSNIIDILEDRIVSHLNKGDDQIFINEEQKKTNSLSQAEEESEYLIFERHFEADKEKISSQNPILQKESKNSKYQNSLYPQLDQINQEELGIIDLDYDESNDGFDELDDDKLPILKNTYSKKNRPNNSKSVSIGSRTQGMFTQSRSETQNIVSKKVNENVKATDKDEISSKLFIGEDFNEECEDEVILYDSKNDMGDVVDDEENNVQDQIITQDQKIQQFEQKIAATINELTTQLKVQSGLTSPQHQEMIDNNIEGQQIQITASVRVNKRPEFGKQRDKPKTNKSFDLKQRGVGLQSPLRSKQGQSANISHLGYSHQEEEKAIVKPPNQLNSCKNLQKRDLQSNQRPQILYSTSPGAAVLSVSQSTKSAQPKILAGSFGSITSSNARKRKSDYQRKSEVPPYASLAQKKLAASSMSQVNNQLEKSSDKFNNSQQHTLSSFIGEQPKKHNFPQATSLIQKAKQAFVSRAKSQSYLNSVGIINPSISQNSNPPQSSRKKEGSFKLSSASNYLGQQQNLSMTNSLGGYRGKKGKTIRLAGDDEQSSTSNLNSACSGGINYGQHQIHKGYFSNDECERVSTDENKKSRIISPPKSGDLQHNTKNQFSHEEKDQSKARASSHHLKRKRINPIMTNETEISSEIQPGKIYLSIEDQSKIISSLRNQRNQQQLRTVQNSHNDSYSDEGQQYKSSDYLFTKPRLNNNLVSPTSEANIQFYPNQAQIRNDEKFDEEDLDEDFDEFVSGDDSVVGQMRQLSCIDEEEDIGEKKTINSKKQFEIL